MGKNYYCEYCDKRFKDDLNVRKKHINGLPHQTAAEEILNEERGKKPCAKFPNGQCQIGASCRFSHYTPQQLLQLQQQADAARHLRLNHQPKIYSKNLITQFLRRREDAQIEADEKKIEETFKYPKELLKTVEELPPSLQPLNARMLRTVDKITFFGDM